MIGASNLIAYLFVFIVTTLIVGFILKMTIKNQNKYLAPVLTILIAILATAIAKSYIDSTIYATAFADNIRKQYPIFELLATKAPDDFNAYIAKEKENIKEYGSSNYHVSLTTVQFLDTEIAKYSAVASNQSLFDFMQTRLNIYKQIYQTDPATILHLEFPLKFPENTNAGFNQYETLYQQNMKTTEEVLKSALENPQAPPTDADKNKATEILKSVALDLAKKYGKDNVIMTFKDPADASLDKNIAAQIIMSLYEDILARGVNDTGVVVKYVFANSNP